jgi:hypothetical protein
MGEEKNMRITLFAACAVLAMSAGEAGAGTFSCEEINGVGDCGQVIQQSGTGKQSVTVIQSGASSVSSAGSSVSSAGSSVTRSGGSVTVTNGGCEIVINGHPPEPC